jgi:RNA polymerase sigma-70 factor (ECF subfamily)
LNVQKAKSKSQLKRTIDNLNQIAILMVMKIKLHKATTSTTVGFQMKYFEELKYEQISEILGTSVGALKASYHHAVKKSKRFNHQLNLLPKINTYYESI